MRHAIQQSQARVSTRAARYGLHPKTVAKWRQRTPLTDAPLGPKEKRSTVLTKSEEAVCVAFRRPTLLPLADGLYSLHPSMPPLTRSAVPRCSQRQGISRLPNVKDSPAKKPFKASPIGYFPIDMAEVRTEEGNLSRFVAIDRPSQVAYAELQAHSDRLVAIAFLHALLQAVPDTIHTILTDNGSQFWYAPRSRTGPTAMLAGPLVDRLCRTHAIDPRLTNPPPALDQWASRTHESHTAGRHGATLSRSVTRPAQTASLDVPDGV